MVKALAKFGPILAQTVGAFAFLLGVALIYLPLAPILGGLALVAGVEYLGRLHAVDARRVDLERRLRQGRPV